MAIESSAVQVTQPTSVEVHDLLKCNQCGHEHLVTHDWLDALTRTGQERLFKIAGPMLAKLKCGKCGHKEFRIKQHELPEVSVKPTHDSGLCNSCGGDGGPGGRCMNCGGTGFR